MSALHFIGKTDTKESMLLMNEQEEKALLRRLLEGRDDALCNGSTASSRCVMCTTPPPVGNRARTS